MILRGLALCLLVGCRGPSVEAPAPAPAVDPPWTGPLAAAPRPGDEVVATVDGSPIYASEVAAQMAAESQDARAALDALVDREVLAAEARRRGLLDAPETREARRRERVRRLIEEGFAREFDGPEDIPAEAIQRAWRHPLVQAHYDHSLTHVVRYVRIPLRKDAAPADVEAARRTAEAIWQKVSAARPPDGDAFAREVAAAYGKPLPTHQQTVVRDSGLDQTFVDAAFSVDEKGEVARPARTPWGWDVLYLDAVIPERHTPFAEAEPEIRRERFQPERAAAFARWVDGLARDARIWRDDSWLPRIAVSSSLDLR